jgi:hypothetical protein
MVNPTERPDNTDKKKLEQVELFRRGIAGNTPEKPPASRYINWFHSQAPYRAPTDLHHQLGRNSWDAAAGDHTHDGTNSPLILEGLTIEGARNTDAYRQSVNALLVRLGAKDNTTAT